MKHFLFLTISIWAVILTSQAQQRIKWSKKTSLSIPEPSDICRNPNQNSFFIVSDRGFLFETDSAFQPIRRTATAGFDYEAVFANERFVYAVEERTRRIQQFDITTLEKVGTLEIFYSGGRNSGFEGMVWNPVKNRFLLITEKSPILIFELDSLLQVRNEVRLKDNISGKPHSVNMSVSRGKSDTSFCNSCWHYSGPSDVSSVTWFNSKLFLLSDEDSEILQINPLTYLLEKRWSLGVLNPEGFYFLPDGTVHVLSDNMQTIYHFPAILTTDGTK